MFKKLLSVVLALCIVFSLFVTVVDICCFNRGFYAKEYKELNTAADIGVSEEALDEMTKTLLDYLQDKRDDLLVKEEVKGIEREIFNKREKDHMVDVKALYQNVLTLRTICMVVALLILLYLYLSHSLEIIPQSFKWGLLIIAAVLAALIVMAVTDFDSFWTSFHHVFFAGNDLWLLDPRTDILIMMVPSEFFFDLVIRIATGFVLVILGLWAFVRFSFKG